jgi:hypothetical protein
MNISDIANSMRASVILSGWTTSVTSTASTTAASIDPITKAFEQADKRVQQQRDVTSTQLSSFGKLKSAFSEVQSTAKTLSNPKTGATDADISKAASDFVKAFNGALKSAQASQSQATSTQEITSARRAETDLRRVPGNDSSLSASLKVVGITQQADGSLAIDATKFQAATQANATNLRATVAKLGQQSQAVATRELADTGNLGSTLKALDTRARSLQSRQSEQKTALASFQQFASAQNATYGNNAATGLAAYTSIYADFK